MKLHSDEQPELRVPIPGHPGLSLVSTDVARYPLTLLMQVQKCLAKAQPTWPPLTANELRALLRLLRQPETLGVQAWIRARFGHDTAMASETFQKRIGELIAKLEDNGQAGLSPRSGALLRMRYLELAPVKLICQVMYLSESHYHRIHLEGLKWLAAELQR